MFFIYGESSKFQFFWLNLHTGFIILKYKYFRNEFSYIQKKVNHKQKPNDEDT